MSEPVVYIELTHHTPESRSDLTGLRLTVDYPQGQALVSILGLPPISESEQLDALCGELRRLGEALLEVARSPQRIHRHGRPEGEPSNS